MIVALVQFELPEPLTREQAREIFLSTAPKYRGIPGLMRKHYVLSQDGRKAGAFYLWRSRADADRFYTAEWTDRVHARYGAPPSVTFFESPVVVDNVTQEITSDS